MEITGKTKVFGIIGNPVSHSLSPVLHNFVYRYYNLDCIYVPFPFHIHKNSDKKLILSLFKNFMIQGLSVTIPYKNLAYQLSNERDYLSNFTKSCNTLIFKNNKLYGYNTDGKGFLDALLKYNEIKNKNVLLLGYGGSSSAIAASLLLHNQIQSLIITGRNLKKAKILVNLLNKNIKHNIYCASKNILDIYNQEVDIIINTTPLGMKGYKEEALPIPENFILKKHIVMDIVYNPIKTKLIMVAKSKKAKIIEGYWMLLYQAIYQMELFLERKIEDNVQKKLKSILLKNLK